MSNMNYDNMGKAPYVKLLPDREVDPDDKITMSLDDIIQVYGPTPVRKPDSNMLRKKPFSANLTQNFKKAPAVRLQTFGGGHFYVAKNSPLIKRNMARNREMALRVRNLARNREIEVKAQAEMNRALNAPILQEKEELVLAKYKMIKTKNGVQRILVPATMDKPVPLLKVPVPRRPLNILNKPPPLIESAISSGSVKSFRSFKSMRSSLSTRLGPPPLVDAASRFVPPPLIESGTRLGPPPLVETSNHTVPPPLIVKKVFAQPPPLIDSQMNHTKPPPLIESKFKFSQPPALIETKRKNIPPLVDVRKNKMMPPLIDPSSSRLSLCSVETRSKGMPPLIDIANDSEDVDMDVDVKPPSLLSSPSFRTISLNERFSNFYH